jgi:hypothetical protein
MGEIRWHEAVGNYDADDCDLAVFCLGFLREVCARIDGSDGDEYGDRYRDMIRAALARDALPGTLSVSVGGPGRSTLGGRLG